MIQQKDIEIKKEWDVFEEKYTYTLFLFGDSIETRKSINNYSFASVTVVGCDYHWDMYRAGEAFPDTDLKDENTFVVPIN